MASVERSASVEWSGDLTRGTGRLELDTSGAVTGLPIDLPTRIGDAGGQTSPEELLAAAYAGCFAMALASVLSADGHPPDRLGVTALCRQGPVEDGFAVTHVELTVRGRAPGVDAEGFREAARRAEAGCPISNAIRGNVEIALDADVAG